LAAELRWILLGLSLPLLAFIWWWTARRSGQARGNAELRESTAGKPVEAMPALDPRYIDDDEDDVRPEPESRDWGVPPFEPLSIRTAEFDRVPVLDGPMMVSVEPEAFSGAASAPAAAGSAGAAVYAAGPALGPAPGPTAAAASAPAPAPAPVKSAPVKSAPVISASAADHSERIAAVAPAPNAAELQRIVTVRVCAVGDARWSGAQLLGAFELHGLAFGRYQVFHRKHVDGRSLFCAASLVEPGTFDMAAMAGQEFRGVTLFAVLPGPVAPLDTLDELFATARGLAEELSGMAQDAKGMPLSPQRAAAMREDVARFQALLAKE
jgi:cell division protein ZipA